MGPPESATRHRENQEPDRRKRPRRLPRSRRCLLKGCERRFRPQRARERYCSRECRCAARAWSCWKAQQSYRATVAGKERRNEQSRRYRERVRDRQQPEPEQAVVAARVITTDFFRSSLRSPWLLSGIHPASAVAAPTILFARVSAGHGTRMGARTLLAPVHAAAAADESQGHS